MAPPRNPAPKPQPNPRPHTFSTSVPAAFLIASASANGAADATLEAATTPAASTAATDMFSIRLDIGFLRFSGLRYQYAVKTHRTAISFLRRYATEIRHDGAALVGTPCGISLLLHSLRIETIIPCVRPLRRGG